MNTSVPPPNWPASGERRAFGAVALVLMLSAAVQGIADVSATSALADSSGPGAVLLLWSVEAAITWLGIALFAPWLSKVAPRGVAVAVAVGFAVLFALLALVTRSAQAGSGWWILVGVINGLQADLLVLAAWTMARDAFDEPQGKRLFGLLSGLSYIGTVAGSGGTALVAGVAQGWHLMALCAGLVFLVVPVAGSVFPHLRHRTSEPDGDEPPARSVLRALVDQPLLRGIGLLQLGNGAAWTAMSLVAILALQLDGDGDASLQRSYGVVRTVGPVVHALAQALLAGALLRRFGYAWTLLITPLALVAALIGLVAAPGATAAWLATLGLQVAFGLEGAAVQVAVLRAPPTVRAEVGAWLTGQLPQVGYLLGSILLGLGLLMFDRPGMLRGLAALGLVMAVVNLVGAWRLRLNTASGTGRGLCGPTAEP